MNYNPERDERIIREVSHILLSPKDNSSSNVSLYDLANVLNEKIGKYNIVANKCCYVTGFDEAKYSYSTKELNIINDRYEYDDITFAKYNGNLYVKKSDSYKTKYLLAQHGEEISKIMDQFQALSNYADLFPLNKRIKSANSSLVIDLSKYEMKINGLEMHAHYNISPYEKPYTSDAMSSKMLELVANMGEDIMKSIFVSIDDCPESIQKELYHIRFEELYYKPIQKEKKKSIWDLFK